MDYQKVDGRLAMEYDNAAGDSGKQFTVFVRTKTPLTAEAVRELERMRIPKPNPSDCIFSMELSTTEVSALSDRPWVISIRSGNKMRPLDER